MARFSESAASLHCQAGRSPFPVTRTVLRRATPDCSRGTVHGTGHGSHHMPVSETTTLHRDKQQREFTNKNTPSPYRPDHLGPQKPGRRKPIDFS